MQFLVNEKDNPKFLITIASFKDNALQAQCTAIILIFEMNLKYF